MIHCESCNIEHPTAVLFCSSCGLQLLHANVCEGDELTFSAKSGWQKSLLVKVDGVLKSNLLNVVLTPGGMVLVDSSEQSRSVSLLSLLQTLQGPAQVLEI